MGTKTTPYPGLHGQVKLRNASVSLSKSHITDGYLYFTTLNSQLSQRKNSPRMQSTMDLFVCD